MGIEIKFILLGSKEDHKYLDILSVDVDKVILLNLILFINLKGRALRYMCDNILKLDYKYSVCFGDSNNDID